MAMTDTLDGLSLGIDIGGTSIDFALVDLSTGDVLCTEKTWTTHDDFSIDLENGLRSLEMRLAPYKNRISSIRFSSTLATNAVATGNISGVGLVLVGYSEADRNRWELHNEIRAAATLYIRGGHSRLGEETEPLDEEGLRSGIQAWGRWCRGIAVASLFSHRNHAHEIAVRRIAGAMLDIPVVCSHEVSHVTGVFERASVAVNNAGLIPLMSAAIEKCGQSLKKNGFNAPLYVVRGDGTLLTSEWAKNRPIETVLSGPASSIRGFGFLATQQGLLKKGERVYVYDMGGTTTDIGALIDGAPRCAVGGDDRTGYLPGVELIDAHIVPLGGDSLVCHRGNGRIDIGPKAVLPLSRGVERFPKIRELVRNMDDYGRSDLSNDATIIAIDENAKCGESGISTPEVLFIANELRIGPRFFTEFRRTLASQSLIDALDAMISRKEVTLVGFTPTDALLVCGEIDLWDPGAATKCADFLSRGEGARRWSDRVLQMLRKQLSIAVGQKILSDDGYGADTPDGSRMIGNLIAPSDDCNTRLFLTRRIGKMGLPSKMFEPSFAEILSVAHFETANAVGAAVSPLTFRFTVDIERLPLGSYRAFTPWGIVESESFSSCVERVRQESCSKNDDELACGIPVVFVSCEEIPTSRVEGPRGILSAQVRIEFAATSHQQDSLPFGRRGQPKTK